MRARSIYRLSIAVLVILYIVVRLWHLTDSCLWFDEIFSVHAAEHNWTGLLSFAAADLIHPPLFYGLLKIWIGLGGESLLWLRLLSVIFASIAIIPFLLLLCKELGRKDLTILLALTFLAVNGPLIKYSQEVRMYSLLMCLTLFSVWLFFRLLGEGKGIVALTIMNILLVYTHYAGWLVVGSELLAVVVFRRDLLERFSSITGIAVAAFIPWIVVVWNASVSSEGLAQNIGWVERPTFTNLLQFLLNLCEPFYAPANSIDPISIYRVTIPIFILLTIAILFLIGRPRILADTRFYILSFVALIPVVLVFVASWLLPYSLWGTRHLIIVSPLFAILFAAAISELKNDWLRIGSISLIILFIGYGLVLQMQRPVEPQIWCAWEQLAPKIEPNGQPQKLYVFEDLNAYHFWFATRGRTDLQVVKVNGVPEMIEDKAYFLPRGFDGVQTINAEEISGGHFWVAFRDMKWDERHPPLNFLLERGYTIGQPETIDAGGLKAFLVQIRK